MFLPARVDGHGEALADKEPHSTFFPFYVVAASCFYCCAARGYSSVQSFTDAVFECTNETISHGSVSSLSCATVRPCWPLSVTRSSTAMHPLSLQPLSAQPLSVWAACRALSGQELCVNHTARTLLFPLQGFEPTFSDPTTVTD